MADPFATAAELSQMIGATEPSDLSRMQLFIDLVSAAIRNYTDQELSQVTGDVITFEPTWSQVLYLPERPVTAVTAVTVKAVSDTNWRLVDERKLIRGSDPNVSTSADWSSGATVTYTHGYAEGTEAYKSIKQVCLEAASNAYTLNQNEATQFMGGTTAETAGFAPAIYLTPAHRMRLDWFKPVAVG